MTDLQKVKSPANPYKDQNFNIPGSFIYVICPIHFQGKTHDSTLVFQHGHVEISVVPILGFARYRYYRQLKLPIPMPIPEFTPFSSVHVVCFMCITNF